MSVIKKSFILVMAAIFTLQSMVVVSNSAASKEFEPQNRSDVDLRERSRGKLI